MMSNMRLLRTNVEKKRMTANTMIAPANAPIIVAKKPDRALPASMEPPANITTATPNAAPVSMPRMDGPANGLLNVVCNSNPATARLLPASRAVIDCGMRDSTMIYRQLSFVQALPVSAFITSSTGIDTEPIKRLHTHSMMVSNDKHTMSRVLYDM